MTSATIPLRILLVTARAEHALSLERTLTAARHRVVGSLRPHEDLMLAVQRIQPEAVVVEVEAPSRDLIRALRVLGERYPLPVVVFADRSSEQDIRQSVKAGVSAYVVDGLLPSRIAPVLQAAVTRFLEFQALRSERDEAIAKLNERRAIERAKGILMRRRDLTEDAAYEVLRKMAMNRGRRLIEVAESIITAEEALSEH
jgi:response regulator NasT